MSKSGHKEYMAKERVRKATEGNIVTVNIWTPQLKIIDNIVKLGYFHSRSQLIRSLIDWYLTDYLERMLLLEKNIDEQKRVMRE